MKLILRITAWLGRWWGSILAKKRDKEIDQILEKAKAEEEMEKLKEANSFTMAQKVEKMKNILENTKPGRPAVVRQKRLAERQDRARRQAMQREEHSWKAFLSREIARQQAQAERTRNRSLLEQKREIETLLAKERHYKMSRGLQVRNPLATFNIDIQ